MPAIDAAGHALHLRGITQRFGSVTAANGIDHVPVSLFLQDARTQVLPIHLWDIIQNQLDSRAASACGVIIILTVVLLLLMERLAGFSRYVK